MADTATPMGKSSSQRALPVRRLQRGMFYALLITLAVLFLIPLFWLVLSSLKTNSEYLIWPIKVLPRVPIWSNYKDAVTKAIFLQYAWRSFFLGAVFTILAVTSSALSGFGFARHRAPGRDQLFILVVAMLMAPGIVTIIPQFMIYSKLHIVNTYMPWILWGLTGSPFHIFLFRQFFSTFPKELEEAAELDGCSRIRVFWQIFMPNAGPVIAASSIFNFQWVWGDFFYQSLFLNERSATLAMKIATAYLDPVGHPLVTITLAGVVLYMLPMMVVYFLAQRYIVQGIVTTGLKG